MIIPNILEFAIEETVNKYDIKLLKDKALSLSKRYMEAERTGESLLANELDTVAYSVIRMPATYCAIKKCLEKVIEIYDGEITSLLDIGSGTGAAEWACIELFDITDIICIEREKSMQNMAKTYFAYEDRLKDVKFVEADILQEKINVKKDLCILSYMINELDKQNRLKVIEKAIDATEKVLLVVEPGTPEGFKNIKQIRDYAYSKGFSIIAPCTGFCGICEIEENDWCASSVRVQRTKIHKYLKDAEVGYEDEKFSYVAICKEKIQFNDKNRRILRHPKIENGRILVKTCINGEIKEEIITKKNKDEFKLLKKKNVGDIF